MTASSDSVQKQPEIATRFCTKSSSGGQPLFFIGSSPSQASKIISPTHPATGVMISVNQLRDRKSDFVVGNWMLDSGAFTEISKYGNYRFGVEEYYFQIRRWSRCGNLLRAVAQDYMCEPFILERTGLSVEEHQQLTIERYDRLISFDSPVPIMPVLQGYRISEYLSHIDKYGERLHSGMWIGVGSVCRRNGNANIIADLLAAIKNKRSDLLLHGFGLKQMALENKEVRSLLHSCDSMAWSYPRNFQPVPTPEIEMAHKYQERIQAALTDSVQKRIARTAGAGNGQGRKSTWKSKTTSIRIPAKYADKLIQIARDWERNEI